MNKKILLTSFLLTILLGSVVALAIFKPPNGSSEEGYFYSQVAPVIKSTEASEDSIAHNATKPSSPDKPVNDLRNNRIGQEVSIDLGYKGEIKKYKLASTPNDPNANQWWENTLKADSTIWDMPAPSKQTTIAVIDTGFALNHEEFSGRFFINDGESGATLTEKPSDLNCTDQSLILDMSCNNVDDNVDGIVDNESGSTTYENPSIYNCTDQSLALDKSCNMIDDDDNGYVDDVSGWDFVNSDASPQAGELREADDVNTYHGTMVAGIAMANANNSVGIVGLDWNAKLLPLQALDDDGYGDSITVSNAIKYAADMNADVINLSLGTDSPDIIILQAVEYAYNKGVLVVASAGNDGCDCMVWPARYDITLSVGSINSSLVKSSFSSYGSALDIVAPGSSMTSSSYSSSNRTAGYATGSGTSFSAPVISGLISLVKSQWQEATPLQLAAIITETADKTINSDQHRTSEHGYGLTSFSQIKERALNPLVVEQLYQFENITNGGVFYGSNNQSLLYSCPDGNPGSTPIYKSAKTNFFYSVNQSDLRYASNNGYTNKSLFEACVLMPNDTANIIRAINTTSELSNTSIKSLLSF